MEEGRRAKESRRGASRRATCWMTGEIAGRRALAESEICYTYQQCATPCCWCAPRDGFVDSRNRILDREEALEVQTGKSSEMATAPSSGEVHYSSAAPRTINANTCEASSSAHFAYSK